MIERLNTLLNKQGLRPLRTGRATVRSEMLADAAAVWRMLRDFGPVQGWVCLTDEVLEISGPVDLDRLEGRIPLSAELVKDACSLHLRQDGAGWQAWRIEAYPDGDQLIADHRLIGTSRVNGSLCYEVYWGCSPDGAYQPLVSRFAGFDKGGNNDE